ncbi:MAG TPA: sialidase family protein [Candidatus Hydrogenedentes bacterium]|nr:sialidase family protein [Candidatus Hydrogenedentota bacterium]HPG66916.1 sialidase family protein [Candidatus Hydrogenedentota bacterium]
MKCLRIAFITLGCAVFAAAHAQEGTDIGGAVVYDYDPATQLGDPVFGTVIADMEHDHPGRCSHGGPVCLQYANGDIAAFCANTSDHNIDGWSEYALSKDGGKTWDMYNKVPYSYEAYQKNPKEPAWVEEALVTAKGTAVLFVTRFRDDKRVENGILRSSDHGSTWSAYEPFDAGVGYPCAVAVSGDTNYVLFDSNGGPHVLYVSTDDGRTWSERSTLPLDAEKWYGTMCIGGDGRLLAGAYTEKDEKHFFYCVSTDDGNTWSEQKAAAVNKSIRDPELAYLGGRYYLHGRSGHSGDGAHRFVLYTSADGENWGEGIVVSSDERSPDGYSHNCVIREGDGAASVELMVLYSIIYEGRDTNEYVFFIRPTGNE